MNSNFKNQDIRQCINCKSLNVSKIRRTFLQRLFSKKSKFYCHKCKQIFFLVVDF